MSFPGCIEAQGVSLTKIIGMPLSKISPMRWARYKKCARAAKQNAKIAVWRVIYVMQLQIFSTLAI
jgi:hypothetical protein